MMCELMHHWFGGDPKDEIREVKRELEKLPSAQQERTSVNLQVEKLSKHQSDFTDLDAQPEHNPDDKRKIADLHKMVNYLLSRLEQRWIPVSEKPPEEDHWLGGSGKQFSDEVLVSVANYDDEDTWMDVSQTIDGNWILELPRHCEIVAWMPLPEPYRKEVK